MSLNKGGLVLKTGLEPVRPNGHWILSPTCLPIPPLQHLDYDNVIKLVYYNRAKDGI